MDMRAGGPRTRPRGRGRSDAGAPVRSVYSIQKSRG